MAGEALVTIDGLNHFFGEGTLRKQILYDISTSIRAGEIVIVTGPSGSGKTTLLTLVGALRSAQDGSLRVLGRELRDATQATLVDVRRQVGFIFQAHNLLGALSASQNVQMALHGAPRLTRAGARARATEMLRAVGLTDRVDHYPHQLSGGQKQRVAIARALALEPRIVLADEPTASLDKVSGREVVDLLLQLARKQDCAVLLVTHDNRILDIADRIVHLEDGRLKGFADAVIANTQQMLATLAQYNRKGELARRVKDLSAPQFLEMVDKVTTEAQEFLKVTRMANSDTFESMLEQVLDAFTLKIGQLLEADRATLFLVDRQRALLWSKIAQGEGEKALDIRVPLGEGVAGHVAQSGEPMNIPDAYACDLFNREVDRRTGYRTKSILCVPVPDSSRNTVAVAQLLNKCGRDAFDEKDEHTLREFAGSMGVILESWTAMQEGQSNGAAPAAG